jgi:hypothetical protein
MARFVPWADTLALLAVQFLMLRAVDVLRAITRAFIVIEVHRMVAFLYPGALALTGCGIEELHLRAGMLLYGAVAFAPVLIQSSPSWAISYGAHAFTGVLVKYESVFTSGSMVTFAAARPTIEYFITRAGMFFGAFTFACFGILYLTWRAAATFTDTSAGATI